VLAGALQDQKRAVLVGNRTFGKGLVQQLMPMQDGDAIVLTIARYYTPSGRSIQAEGISPDIDIGSIRTATLEAEPAEIIREADLAGRLAPESAAAKRTVAQADSDEKLAEKDFALYESVETIRGMLAYRPVG
jgi:carboxyl-terminal processing protease